MIPFFFFFFFFLIFAVGSTWACACEVVAIGDAVKQRNEYFLL